MSLALLTTTTTYRSMTIIARIVPRRMLIPKDIVYRMCMANLAENKSFCEVPKYVINTRPHCPKLMKFMDELPK